MHDRIDGLADQLVYEVTDEAAGVGRYQWKAKGKKPDAEVVGYLVNHHRTSRQTIDGLVARLQRAEAELEQLRHPQPPELSTGGTVAVGTPVVLGPDDLPVVRPPGRSDRPDPPGRPPAHG